MADPAVFPFVAQTKFVDIPETLLPGDVFEYEHYNSRVERALIAKVTPVSQVTTIQIGANNPGDTVGVTIDGGTVSVTAGASPNATALLLETALEAASFLGLASTDVTVSTDTVTVAFPDNIAHTVVEYSPDATTATVLTPTAAVGQEQLLYGMGVARRLPIATTNNNCVVKPSSMSDVFAGILFRTHGTNLPPDQILAAGFDPDYLCPGFPYSRGIANMGVVVSYVGSAPSVGDPVYWIKTGANAGLWSIVDGSVAGTSEVVTLTLTTTAADTVAFNYDGLPDLSIASASGTEATDAATLYALWKANASYMAVGDIVDNLDGTLTITFADDTTHVFTDNSGGTSSIAESVDTPAVAATPANAELRSEYSWAKPSVTSGDPTRAFLRLSNP